TVPDGTVKIPDYAFSGFSALKEVKLPDGLTDLGPAAFSKCDRIESIKIPGGVIKVGENTFSECINLKSAELCEGVVAIEYGAFEKCEALTTIVLPGSLKKICGYYEEEEDFDGHGRVMRTLYYQAAFSNCKSLKKVLFRGTRAQWEQIEIGKCNELQKAEVEFDYKL
ncbi:MAG: leucine-rich repeat domain-containing protein, partial [Clostridia bacterium]|nr:leucine-rich repeat domain-containing protein [Clostridia bacterium]